MLPVSFLGAQMEDYLASGLIPAILGVCCLCDSCSVCSSLENLKIILLLCKQVHSVCVGM